MSTPHPRVDPPVGAPAPGAPIVVVGTGPVGMRAAREILARAPETPLVIYGDEPWAPYERVRLTSLLLGEVRLAALDNPLRLPPDHRVVQHLNCPVMAIDREACTIRDAADRVQPYSVLILATGSRPHVPDIPGIRRSGVHTFRDLNDAQRLMARRARSRHTVVLGGGLLGIEAARASRRGHTEVTLVHHGSRLMNSQLDDEAASRLSHQLAAWGVRIVLHESVREVIGDRGVRAVRLGAGGTIVCDTLVVATGIRPNIALALNAGLNVGRGIRVDDAMRTSDPRIFAAGECAEHRGRVYGLVAPGLEQAAVVAANILGERPACYRGSVSAARLKVLGLPLASVGRVGEEEHPAEIQYLIHHEGQRYRKLALRRGRLVGALGVGDWPELARMQEAIGREQRVHAWQRARFRRTGSLWSTHTSVAAWPANATVCNCAGVSRGALAQAMAAGCTSIEQLGERTGAGRICGSCRPLLAQLTGAAAPVPQPGRMSTLAGIAAAIACVATLLFVAQIPVADTVQAGWQPQMFWLDGFWKQVSGYALLALGVIASALSLRKRWPRVTLGKYAWWRVAHVLLGALAVATLIVHTGLRLGNHLNFGLIAAFLTLIALGSVVGGVAALERAPGRWTRRLRAWSGYAHVALLWPLPVLLGFHILVSYYF